MFLKRGCDGSEKEMVVFQEMLDTIFYCKSLIEGNKGNINGGCKNNSDNKIISNIDTKELVENVDYIVQSINNLQKRKFVSYPYNLFFFIHIFREMKS